MKKATGLSLLFIAAGVAVSVAIHETDLKSMFMRALVDQQKSDPRYVEAQKPSAPGYPFVGAYVFADNDSRAKKIANQVAVEGYLLSAALAAAGIARFLKRQPS